MRKSTTEPTEKPTATLHEGDGNVLDFGWYYSVTELPDEGSVGPYESQAEAKQWGTEAGYVFE